MSHDSEQEHDYEYRYQITRHGQKVGWFEAEWHGAARWEIHHPDFMDPGEPRTVERLDASLYAGGFEVMPDE